MPVLGIDVSHHNGPVDWDSVSRSSVAFAYVKATEGRTLVDPMFPSHWAALAATPLLRGAYHFARPGISDPETQAQHFAAVASAPGTLPPALDLETGDGLPAAAVIEWVRAFVSRAEMLFRRELLIYTGRYWREELGDPLLPELGTRMLWTARYGNHEPVVPRTWSRWDFWQFTDGESGDVQAIPGVRGPVDCDRWRGDLPGLRSLAATPST